MKYIIIGANGETGSDVNISLEAQNAEEARLQANALGILVSSIVPADAPNPANAMTSLNPTQIPPPNNPPAAPTKAPPLPQPTATPPAATAPQKLTPAAVPASAPTPPAKISQSPKPSFFRTYRVPLIIGGVLVGGLAFIILITVVILAVLLMKPAAKPAYSSYSSGSGSGSSSGSTYSPPPSPPPVTVESGTARTKRRTIECWNATIAINNSLSRLATDNRTEYWGQMIERYSALDTTDVAPEVQTYISDWLAISRGYYNAMTDYNRKCAGIREQIKTARDTAYRMSKTENAELAANLAELAAIGMYDSDQKKYDAAYRSAISDLDSTLTTFNGNVKSVQQSLTTNYGIQF